MAEVYKTFAISLDVKVASYVKVPVVEGDTGNRFVITLTDDGTAVDLSTSRVTAVFSGAMGTALQDSWSGTDGQLVISGASHNIITFDLLNGSFANGLNTCQLQVYSGATYTTLITSASFTFDAKKPIVDDETIASTSEYPILVKTIERVEALGEREQPDWDETDTSLGRFIKNKPVIGTDIQAPTETLTAETTLSDTDTVPFYDASASAHRKSTWANIVAKIRTAFFGSITGLLKLDGAGNGSAAVANTDFAAAEHAARHAMGGADDVMAEPRTLRLYNQSVTTSGWATYTASGTVETAIKTAGYTYKKTLTISGIFATMTLQAHAAPDKALCGAGIHETMILADGSVSIYATNTPTSAFTILSMIFYKEVTA